jgi:MoxR-like ATPase
MSTDFRADLARVLRAGSRVVAIDTDDEARAVTLLEDVGRELSWPVHTWSIASGVDGAGGPRTVPEILERLRGDRDDALWVLLDVGAVVDAAALRRLRELAQRNIGPALVLVERAGPSQVALARIPEFVPLTLPPPDRDELEARLHTIAAALEESGWRDATARLSAGGPAILDAAAGLPGFAYDRLLAEAVLAFGLDVPAVVGYLRGAKPAVLGRGGLLDPIAVTDADELGGLERLEAWLALRKRTFSSAAAAAGIGPARGCLLVGVQGCGKSLAARVCGRTLELPLVRLDPGRLFGGTVGASEANLRQALSDLDRMAPAVLWIDELDKGFAGAEGSASDAGTAARVLGGLLTWLQERTQPIFVVATANRVDLLPAELLRRGRFDEIFFIDLPDADARERITALHFQRTTAAHRPGDPWPAFARIARAADGYSGAELAAALAEARVIAFARGRPVTADDFAAALAASIPLSVLRAEDVLALRHWASGRARPA